MQNYSLLCETWKLHLTHKRDGHFGSDETYILIPITWVVCPVVSEICCQCLLPSFTFFNALWRRDFTFDGNWICRCTARHDLQHNGARTKFIPAIVLGGVCAEESRFLIIMTSERKKFVPKCLGWELEVCQNMKHVRLMYSLHVHVGGGTYKLASYIWSTWYCTSPSELSAIFLLETSPARELLELLGWFSLHKFISCSKS